MPELPAGIARVEFEPERVDYAAPEASGRQGGGQAGWPRAPGPARAPRRERRRAALQA
ncbi:hypothetical protein [uncultured Sphingopyxis sp.]|uniref:hypothetical protein n=1 Tax=uncultured Sphingopyxis sp. TaxID=310581 RepID=UPI00259A1E1B|nr:hypothetical protein [uncultured Sphingopyxis sp.]